MTDTTKHSADQLQDAAAAVIGRIVLVLSRLEFNVGLYLRNAVGGTDTEAATPLVERLNFKSKLDALSELVGHKLAARPEASQELKVWLREMGTFRARRNAFVHGRWGFLDHAQQVVNVARDARSRKPAKEVR